MLQEIQKSIQKIFQQMQEYLNTSYNPYRFFSHPIQTPKGLQTILNSFINLQQILNEQYDKSIDPQEKHYLEKLLNEDLPPLITAMQNQLQSIESGVDETKNCP